MKVFLKVLAAVIAVVGTVIGALAIIDKFINKNRIKKDYLECDSVDDLSDASFAEAQSDTEE